MRLMVFFDLPVGTSAQRKAYAQFRKNLIKLGFIMFQQSVYIKFALTDAVCKHMIAEVVKICPRNGLVHILKITENQFSEIVDVNGSGIMDTETMSSESVLVL